MWARTFASAHTAIAVTLGRVSFIELATEEDKMLSWLAQTRSRKCLGVLVVAAAFLVVGAVAPAAAQGDKRVVKVMTYNMDAGTDFNYILQATTQAEFAAAVAATIFEVEGTDFQGRAAALAQKIDAEKPDFVSLQEATLWNYVEDDFTTQVRLVADQLAFLKNALKKKNLKYEVLVEQPLTNLVVPLADNFNFHFLDRNVVLMRSDTPDVTSTGQAKHNFVNNSPSIGGFTLLNGWIAVDATVRGKNLRLFATHLATDFFPGDNTQELQGQELIVAMSGTTVPVILAGDFNSDMSGLDIGPDQTTTGADIAAAGYTDTWTVQNAAWEGLTWPLYGEDQYTDIFPRGQPFERIDLIFTKGLGVQKAKVVGTDVPYPSDHAGVVAWLELNK